MTVGMKRRNVPKPGKTWEIFRRKDLAVLQSNSRFSAGLAHHYVVKYPDAVNAAPVDDEMNVFVIREWRSGWNNFLYKLPGGAVRGIGEGANVRAIRGELLQEAGIRAKRITKLASVKADVNIVHRIYLYLAQGLSVGTQELEDFEYIKVIKMPFVKAYKRFVKNNSEMTSESVLCLALAKEKLKL